MSTVKDYILQNWPNTIRENKEDKGNLIGLPKPYTVPCMDGMFQELYYWDTYFTNVGLILSGMVEQAKNNVDNMLYLIDRYGFMPNGSRTFYLSRSQPPFLSQMVREVYKITGDKLWLRKAYDGLTKEYAFWQQERMTPVGLERYYGQMEDKTAFGAYMCERFSMPVPEDKATVEEYGACMLSFAESGWDCTSRVGLKGHEYVWADLNALLYGMEQNMAGFATILANGEAPMWASRAAIRKAKMDELLWDEAIGGFCDYRFVEQKRGDLISTAMFYPLFAGAADERQAAKTVALLAKLEQPYGVACCEAREDIADLQWDYPHGWACQQYVVIQGLLRYGYTEDAKRIARKYTSVVEANFETTHNLWEKYNVVTGLVSETKEYETPPMMGWSAGVYLACLNILEK